MPSAPAETSKHRNVNIADLCVILGGCGLLALTTLILLAWASGGDDFRQNLPAFFRISSSLLLGLALSGIALLSALKLSKRYILTAAALVLVMAVLTLTESMTGLAVIQLFHVNSHPVGSPARIALVPPIVLAFAGSFFFFITFASKQWSLRTPILEGIGLVVVAAGAEAVLGNFQPLIFKLDWGAWLRLSPLAGSAVVLLGIGLVGLALRQQERHTQRMPLWLPALLCFVVLMFDISTPLPLAAGIAYIPIIFCSLWFRGPNTVFVFAAVTSVLTLLGAWLSPPGTSALWIAVSNRLLTMGALWSVALLVHLTMRSEGALKQSTMALTDSEERYALAVRGLSIGIWDWNILTGELFWSPRFKAIMGVPADFNGMQYDAYATQIHPDDQARTMAMLQAHLRGDGPFDTEYRRQNADGHYIWLQVMGQATWNAQGVATRMVGSIEDITARKTAEEAKWQLAAVVESSGDAIITKTLEGTITSWNAGAERMLGYAARDVIGLHIGFLMPDDRKAEEAHIISEIGQGRRVEHYETIRLARDGRRVDISLTISPIRNAAGGIIGASKIARDISERRETEKILAQYTRDLERSNQELDDFAYIASHDLKEPLRGLYNNARFLLEDYGETIDAAGKARLVRLGFLTQRMEQLVNDLLYFSRLGRQAMAIQSTDINAVVRDIESLLEPDATGETRISIPHVLPTIICDKIRITEVFRNLISNAIKYNSQTLKQIDIGYLDTLLTRTGIEHHVFYVKDNGIGIESDFHEEIFRIFKRLNEEDDAKKGTGVGLTYVRKIIDRHGGRIWLESKPGEGTTFYFTLSRGDDHVAAA